MDSQYPLSRIVPPRSDLWLGKKFLIQPAHDVARRLCVGCLAELAQSADDCVVLSFVSAEGEIFGAVKKVMVTELLPAARRLSSFASWQGLLRGKRVQTRDRKSSTTATQVC